MRLLFFLCATATLVGCTRSDSLSPSDTITTIIGSPVGQLNPLLATDANSQHINELVHSGLTKTGPDLLPQPALALKFRRISPLIVEFNLRPNCFLHDGKPITAATVIQSWKYYLDPAQRSAFAENFSRIQKMEALGKYRLRIHTSQPEPALLSDLQLLKIIGDPAGKIGAGPMRILQQNPQAVKLERIPGHCLGEAKSKYITIRAVRDDLSRFLKLQKGEVDIVLNELNLRKIEHIQNDPKSNLAAKTGPGIGFTYLGVNFSEKKLQDQRVRRALALSLNIPELIRYKNRNFSQPAASMLSPQNFYANRSLQPISRNLTEAKKLLDAAGYFNGENKKPPLVLIIKSTTNQIVAENVRVLVYQAKAAGIELQHQALEWGTFYADVKSKNTQLYLLRWVGVSDPRAYFENFHSGELPRNNRTNYQNPEMDRWIMRGQSALDPQQRKAAFDRVQEIAAADFPYINLWHSDNSVAFRKNIKGVELHPSGSWEPFLQMYKEN